jgi:hypothetical protein
MVSRRRAEGFFDDQLQTRNHANFDFEITTPWSDFNSSDPRRTARFFSYREQRAGWLVSVFPGTARCMARFRKSA